MRFEQRLRDGIHSGAIVLAFRRWKRIQVVPGHRYRTGSTAQRQCRIASRMAFSLQLRQAHQRLRDQLTRIRAEAGGDERAATELQVHCLAFCSALAAHHAGEDGGMFADLLGARPDLAPAIKNLIDDHAAIAAILLQVRATATQAKAAPAEALPGLRRELDGLAAIAESHFRYEERAIGAALDKVLDDDAADTGWSRLVFRHQPIGQPGRARA